MKRQPPTFKLTKTKCRHDCAIRGLLFSHIVQFHCVALRVNVFYYNSGLAIALRVDMADEN